MGCRVADIASELRELQKVWFDAAKELKLHEARLEEAKLWRAVA